PAPTSIAPASTVVASPPPPMTTPAPATTAPPAVVPSEPPTTSCPSGDVPIDASPERHAIVRPAQASTALVIAIHGYGGTPEGLELYSELTGSSNAAGVTVAYPQGTPLRTFGGGWNSGATALATTGVDDVAVILSLLDQLEADGCVVHGQATITGE